MFKAFDAMSDSLSLVPLQKKFSDVIHKPAHWTVSWVSRVHTQTHTHIHYSNKVDYKVRL